MRFIESVRATDAPLTSELVADSSLTGVTTAVFCGGMVRREGGGAGAPNRSESDTELLLTGVSDVSPLGEIICCCEPPFDICRMSGRLTGAGGVSERPLYGSLNETTGAVLI